MRCPKCQYLGFDGQDRCRNCGYDFSLSSTLPTPDSPVLAGPDPARAMPEAADLPLRLEPTARERARAAIRQRQVSSRTPGGEAFDLPLFEETPEAHSSDTRPLVAPSPTPRPPLAVRRATVEAPRGRGGAAPAPIAPAPALDLDALEIALAATPTEAAPPTSFAVADVQPAVEADARQGVTPAAASIGARIVGGLIDALILGTIDAAVLWFTLQLTGVAWTQIARLPPAPLVAFLALLAIGYLSMFTVLAGQTVGQMATGIRVVEIGGRPVRFGHAVVRAAAQVTTIPLLGVGFLPALLAADRRALYDRLSDTEVIRSDA